ncbi:Gfo/Idh/MocA family oxidoreductase [Clostridium sp. YIM B02506]|uniref:Gfo/Idh/MocA family protein n=1 Tax=Clostridium sp. YIM B02506 TaxID=2910680 RepID=UPI001EEE7FFF|nr:Gfo/Idh/MocA family oxidoreductase [Clostridium sp. YIM B02506]
MIKVGIVSPSEIALRRFLPAINKADGFEFVGVAIANEEEWLGNDRNKTVNLLKSEYDKAKTFVEAHGGKIYNGYKNLIKSKDIDAVYLPLPPELHYKWAKIALENGKHLLVEKPATTNLSQTEELIQLAEKNKLAVHENYMFTFHKQLEVIEKFIKSGEIGDVRLYRIAFGFPRRSILDFRYNKELGGGALLDCGGYTIKYASMLLGDTCKFLYAYLNYTDDCMVDMFGSAAMVNDLGTTAQISFGMDNNYKCELEVWGSKGYLRADRVLTAPVGFNPSMTIKIGNEESRVLELPEDDSFNKSILRFESCIINEETRKENYKVILKQAKLIDEYMNSYNISKPAKK